MQLQVPIDLIRKYDRPGPRYTSYPTAIEFTERFTENDYVRHLRESNAVGKPLSLYFHLPFCKSVCYFCACSVVYTNKRERAVPYVDQLIREMELVRPHVDAGREVTQLHWGGGTPTFLAPDLMRSLQAAARRIFPFAADAEISVEVDPREASTAHLDALSSAGFNRLSLGVQDFDPQVQEAVNRIQPYDLTAKVLSEARGRGFTSVNFDLIYGLPRQTLASMRQTLELALDLKPDRLAFFNFAYLPEMKSHMRRIDPKELPAAETKLAMLEMAVSTLLSSGYRYIGMDHFARPGDELAVAQDQGTLHRNFQGYTTRAGTDMLAFGATSIGAVGGAYVQNVKTVDVYADRVNNGRLPTVRGVSLTADDKLRHEVIMTLINRLHIDLDAVGRAHGVDARAYFGEALGAMREFEDDGLVNVTGTKIQVTPAGRFLIRNICMLFDAYRQSDPAVRQFSRTV